MDDVSVPSFGFWITSTSLKVSMPKRVVVVAPGKLLEYVEAVTAGLSPAFESVEAKASGLSETTRPVSGWMRKFWSASETTRTRSATGLKSNPNSVPTSPANGLVWSVGSAARRATRVAAPEVVSRV